MRYIKGQIKVVVKKNKVLKKGLKAPVIIEF